jgi:branched-chain amino acid transport system substrate-binding protein
LTRQNPGGGQTAGQGGGAVPPPAHPLAAFVYPDGSMEELQPPGAAAFLGATPPLVDYALAHAESATFQVRFFWQHSPGRWVRVDLDRAPPDSHGQAVLVTVTPMELPAGLTPRELDVLTLMACGLSNQEIAGRLHTSSRTVSTQVEHVLGKLGQASRAGAAGVAADRGYLRLPVPGSGALPEGITIGHLHARAEAAAAPAPAVRPAPAPAVRPASRVWARRPLLIGSAFPLHGPARHDGREMANGSALAAAEINASGGIGGRRIEQIVMDMDIFSTRDVARVFQQLIDAEVDAITSSYLFAGMDTARTLAAAYGAPYVHAMTSESQAQIVRDNQGDHSGVFQVCPTELYYGPGFIRFLNDLREGGWRPPNRRLAFVETPLPSGQMVNQLAIDLAERSGWQISGVETVPALGADWPAMAERMEQLDPAAIMITQFLAGELASFQRLIVQRLPGALVYAIYAPSVPEFLELAGPASEGLVWATVTGTYSDMLGRRFRSDYAQAFGRPAGRSHAGIAYDEIHLLAQAWMAVPNPSHFPAVAGQLRRLRYRGVNGSYYLDNAGQSGLGFPDVTRDPSLGQAHLVFQVQNGTHRIICPQPYAESTFRVPSRRADPPVAGWPTEVSGSARRD